MTELKSCICFTASHYVLLGSYDVGEEGLPDVDGRDAQCGKREG
jgi:hypothetical protein